MAIYNPPEPQLAAVSTLARFKKATSGGAEWASITEAAAKATESLPLPRSADELWKYTRPELFPLKSIANIDSSWRPTISGLPSEVQHATNLEVLPAQYRAKVSSILKTFSPLYPLEAALVASGAAPEVFYVGKGKTVAASLKIQLGGAAIAATTYVCVVDESADLSLWDEAGEDFTGCDFSRWVFLIGKNARLSYSSLQHASSAASVLRRQQFFLARDARLTTGHVALGGGAARVDLDCTLEEPGASAELSGASFVNGKRHNDFHTNQIHQAPHCHSNLFFKGAVTDSARSVYYGYIRVADGAQKTHAYQANRNMVLSDSARCDSIPNLEIKANDVKCSHGSSTGQVNPEEIFYLMSRGLTREHAEQLLVEAFFEDVIARIPVGDVRSPARDLILSRVYRGKN